MKKCFITGLVILLPAVLTIMLFAFIINFLTAPFVGLLQSTLEYFNLLNKQIFFVSSGQVLTMFSRIIILVMLFIVTVLIGLLTRILLFHYFLRFGNFILNKIPLVNKIYKAIQDAIKTLFEEKTSRFSQVVLVPFPYENTLSLGLITNEPEHSLLDEAGKFKEGSISVFVPATPNPTMGFILQYHKDQMIYLNMSVEEAIKFIVSCGVMSSGFDIKNSEGNI